MPQVSVHKAIDDFVNLNEYVAAPSVSEMGFHDFLRFRVLLPRLQDGFSILSRLEDLGISEDVWKRVTESLKITTFYGKLGIVLRSGIRLLCLLGHQLEWQREYTSKKSQRTRDL